MNEPTRPTARQARARLDFDNAKLEADSWAHIIAQDCLAALESGEWGKLPTRGMLLKFKDARAVRDRAAEALFAATEGVAS